MNHLESSFAGRNSFWRYIVMFAAVMVATNTIGALPLIIAISAKAVTDPGIMDEIASNPNDLSALGFNTDVNLLLMLFPFIVGLAAYLLLVKPLHGRSLRVTLNGTEKIRWGRIFGSAFIWLILSAIYLFVYLKAEPSNFTLNNTSSSLITLSVITLLFVPFQAAFEEILFRGYLMQGFAVLFRNRWLPLVITSVLFGLMHSFNPEVEDFGFFVMMPQYILFGHIFGIITVMDDGVEAAAGAHAANNIFLCIMVTNDSSALQTDALFRQHEVSPATEFIALFVTGIVFLIILKYIFRWGAFSKVFSRVEAKPVIFQTE